MIATVTLNPALDKIVYLDRLLVGDTNRIIRTETDAGGKGINASRMLRALGAETVALGLIGGRTGTFIEHVLQREGVRTDFIEVTKETRTNIQIQTEDGEPPTALDEKGGPVTLREIGLLIERVDAVAGSCEFVLFGGSIPLGVPVDVYERLINCVEAHGAKAILDAEGELLLDGLQATPFMIKPNRDEAQRLVQKELPTEADVIQAAKTLRSKGISLAIISLGKQGAIAASKEGVWKAVPPPVEAVSTVGSGDSMVAGIVFSLSRNGSLEDALRLGSACGAATAMSSGVEMGRKEDVERLAPQINIMRLE